MKALAINCHWVSCLYTLNFNKAQTLENMISWSAQFTWILILAISLINFELLLCLPGLLLLLKCHHLEHHHLACGFSSLTTILVIAASYFRISTVQSQNSHMSVLLYFNCHGGPKL